MEYFDCHKFILFQIDTAVLFLRGPQVQQTPLELRKQFLKKKGLTDNEIAIACDKAGINTFTQFVSFFNLNLVNSLSQ